MAKMKLADISPIEQYIIDKIREMRIERGISQRELAYKLDISSGFIGDVESIKSRAKYNVNLLNEIAKIFNCSPKDFMPKEPL
jgi:transcriptional regulator with XRE-family HTH domain